MRERGYVGVCKVLRRGDVGVDECKVLRVEEKGDVGVDECSVLRGGGEMWVWEEWKRERESGAGYTDTCLSGDGMYTDRCLVNLYLFITEQ